MEAVCELDQYRSEEERLIASKVKAIFDLVLWLYEVVYCLCYYQRLCDCINKTTYISGDYRLRRQAMSSYKMVAIVFETI